MQAVALASGTSSALPQPRRTRTANHGWWYHPPSAHHVGLSLPTRRQRPMARGLPASGGVVKGGGFRRPPPPWRLQPQPRGSGRGHSPPPGPRSALRRCACHDAAVTVVTTAGTAYGDESFFSFFFRVETGREGGGGGAGCRAGRARTAARGVSMAAAGVAEGVHAAVLLFVGGQRGWRRGGCRRLWRDGWGLVGVIAQDTNFVRISLLPQRWRQRVDVRRVEGCVHCCQSCGRGGWSAVGELRRRESKRARFARGEARAPQRTAKSRAAHRQSRERPTAGSCWSIQPSRQGAVATATGVGRC